MIGRPFMGRRLNPLLLAVIIPRRDLQAARGQAGTHVAADRGGRSLWCSKTYGRRFSMS